MIVKNNPDMDDLRGQEIDTIEVEDDEVKIYLLDGSILYINSNMEGTLSTRLETPE